MSKLETELMEVKSSSDGEAEVVAHEAVASVVAPGDAGPFAVPLKPAVRPLLLSPQLFNGNGEYVCSVCGESFFSLAQLAKHVQFHDRDRPFPCAVCGKRFLSRSHHTEHQRVHTGERPFPCNRCERAFTTHHNLKRHQLIHDKEEMYRCSVCGVLFCQEHQLGNIGGIIRVLRQHDVEPLIDPRMLLRLQLLPETKPAVEATPARQTTPRKMRKKKHKRDPHHPDSDLYSARSDRHGHSGVPEVHESREVDVHEVTHRPAPKIQKIAYDIEVIL